MNLLNEHQRNILKLALPISISNLSQMVLGLIDSAMVGAIHSDLLASAALVNSLIAIPTILVVGLSFGLSPLISAGFGAEKFGLIRSYLVNGIIAVGIVAVILSLLIQFFTDIIFLLGQEEKVAKGAFHYFRWMGWSMIPLGLFMAMKQFCDGVEQTRLPMVLMLLSIPINTVLNAIFIYGHFGIPGMGLDGAGVATLITRIFMVLALSVALIHSEFFRNMVGKWYLDWKLERVHLAQIFKLGVPTSMQYAMESWAFSVSGIMMGWLGAKALAAHQIALGIASFTFMGAMGVSAAGSIKVGVAKGQNNFSLMRTYGKATFQLSVAYGLICGIIFVIFRNYIPYLFNREVEVVSLAATLLVYAALFQLSDSTQATGVGLCRGLQDVLVPTIFVFMAYWIIGIPVGYLSAFTWGLGPPGIWLGLFLGLSSSAFLLNRRFFRKTSLHF